MVKLIKDRNFINEGSIYQSLVVTVAWLQTFHSPLFVVVLIQFFLAYSVLNQRSLLTLHRFSFALQQYCLASVKMCFIILVSKVAVNSNVPPKLQFKVLLYYHFPTNAFLFDELLVLKMRHFSTDT
ncbi:hypothetical protein EGR_01861 [Echinococcus granulosus]|uniref:Uncharacterized protein n=1 Tax=Echinococcus granulosus TaxID=6210 RepID=W6UNW8_ECHGR|nr:hypothetical protein EGR_01861 [Echinococcus granulosus]EUB63370.1 hypothetical protein EGR_01861 [Echinococcus granulosus]